MSEIENNVTAKAKSVLQVVSEFGLPLVLALAFTAQMLYQNHQYFNRQTQLVEKVISVIESNTNAMEEVKDSVDDNSKAIQSLQRLVNQPGAFGQ